MVAMRDITRYWDEYGAGIRVNGEEWASREFFKTSENDHNKAYADSNEILDIPSQSGKSILDIYCGIGIDALELARHGAIVTFMSPSPVCVDLTRKYFALHHLNAKLIVGNAEELCFQKNTFDVVVARGILMFTPHPEIAIDEIYRVLKPGGKVYAHLHNRFSWYVILARLTRTNLIDNEKDPPIHRCDSRKDGKRMFFKFSSLKLCLARLPLKTAKRPGMYANLYNRIFVPFTRVIPKKIMKRFGYYIIVTGTKRI